MPATIYILVLRGLLSQLRRALEGRREGVRRIDLIVCRNTFNRALTHRLHTATPINLQSVGSRRRRRRRRRCRSSSSSSSSLLQLFCSSCCVLVVIVAAAAAAAVVVRWW